MEAINSIPENLCKVCYQEANQWIIFRCQHSFCLRCVLEYHKAKYPLGFKGSEVSCLEQGCKSELSLISAQLVEQIIPNMHFSVIELL